MSAASRLKLVRQTIEANAPIILALARSRLRVRIIENDGAQICADLRCPNPYLALESLSGPHEAWWLNVFRNRG